MPEYVGKSLWKVKGEVILLLQGRMGTHELRNSHYYPDGEHDSALSKIIYLM